MGKHFWLTVPVFLAACLFLTGCPADNRDGLRQKVDFNRDWLFLRLDEDLPGESGLGTTHSLYDTTRSDFLSQYVNEYVQSGDTAVVQALRKEVQDAVFSFRKEFPSLAAKKWSRVSLPHTAAIAPLVGEEGAWEGVCYYRKSFTPAAGWRNKRLLLVFEGTMQQSDIWVNGKLVRQHKGGYTPFAVDLSDLVAFGQANEIVVRLDNRAGRDFPVGKDLDRNGFTYWSGIYRSVSLNVTNRVFITDAVEAGQVAGGGAFFRAPEVCADHARILVKTNIANRTPAGKTITVKQVLSDAAGKIAGHDLSAAVLLDPGAATHITQEFTIANPRLWHPDHPALYTLKTTVYAGGRKTDELEQRVGLRKLAFSSEKGFLLNDQAMYLTGTNRHQDYPFIGVALSRNAHYRDMKAIKEAGYNAVRLAHYPQDPAVYDAADELGLMVIDCIPGWQFFNDSPLFKQRVLRDIRDMIRRDRNHPCVVLWEPNLNEGYPPDEFRRQCNAVAHQELPAGEFFTTGETYAARRTDWDVAINNWSEPPDAIFRNRTERAQDIQPGAPGFIKEYGDWEFGGWNSTSRSSRASGEEAMLQAMWNIMWEYNSNLASYSPGTVGCCTWAMFDNYLSSSRKIFQWGTADYFRLPKFTEYLFRSQLEPYEPVAGIEEMGPVVLPATWWTAGKENRKVVVFSNCEELVLKVNDEIVGKQGPDSGPNTPYGVPSAGGHPFGGGNCRSLRHPPFTFGDVPFAPGELKAEGYIGGIMVAEGVVRTPGKPLFLEMWADLRGRPVQAGGVDHVFVHAALVDGNGTVSCLDNDTEVEFSVRGEAGIAGPSVVRARGGIASILLLTDLTEPGDLVITARADGLKSGELVLEPE